MDKPRRPHPPEMEKTDHFTSTDMQHDAKISYLLWLFFGSAAITLWAVLLDSIRSHSIFVGNIRPHVTERVRTSTDSN